VLSSPRAGGNACRDLPTPGEIGTSPPYTTKAVFIPAHGMPLDAPIVIGAVSVIFGALIPCW